MRQRRWAAAGILLATLLIVRALLGVAADIIGGMARNSLGRSADNGDIESRLSASDLCRLQGGLNPLDPEAAYMRGKALHLLAVKGMPDAATAERALGRSLPEGVDPRAALFDEAAAEYSRAARLDLGDARALRWEAWALWSKSLLPGEDAHGLRVSALRRIDAAAWIRPTDVPILVDQGDLNMKMGDEEHLERAKKAYTRALLCGDEAMGHIVNRLLLLPGGFFQAVDVMNQLPERRRDFEQFSDILFERGRIAESAESWRMAARLQGRDVPKPFGDNLLANPGFEDRIGTWFHDWHVDPQVGTEVGITDAVVHAGSKSLSIRLSPGPANYYHVYQRVPVEAGRRYDIAGWIRGDGFAPGVALGIEVIHPRGFERFSTSARVAPEDGAWMPLGLSFVAPEDVSWVIVRVRRFTAENLSLIGGTVYVDELSLVPAAEPEVAQPAEAQQGEEP